MLNAFVPRTWREPRSHLSAGIAVKPANRRAAGGVSRPGMTPLARVKHARQPDHDLREYDAEPDAEPLQRHEIHRGAEDRGHGDFRRGDALQVEQGIAERRR